MQPAVRFMEVTGAAAPELEPTRGKDLYFEAEKILCQDEAIIIPIWHSTLVHVAKPCLERTNIQTFGVCQTPKVFPPQWASMIVCLQSRNLRTHGFTSNGSRSYVIGTITASSIRIRSACR